MKNILYVSFRNPKKLMLLALLIAAAPAYGKKKRKKEMDRTVMVKGQYMTFDLNNKNDRYHDIEYSIGFYLTNRLSLGIGRASPKNNEWEGFDILNAYAQYRFGQRSLINPYITFGGNRVKVDGQFIGYHGLDVGGGIEIKFNKRCVGILSFRKRDFSGVYIFSNTYGIGLASIF